MLLSFWQWFDQSASGMKGRIWVQTSIDECVADAVARFDHASGMFPNRSREAANSAWVKSSAFGRASRAISSTACLAADAVSRGYGCKRPGLAGHEGSSGIATLPSFHQPASELTRQSEKKGNDLAGLERTLWTVYCLPTHDRESYDIFLKGSRTCCIARFLIFV